MNIYAFAALFKKGFFKTLSAVPKRRCRCVFAGMALLLLPCVLLLYPCAGEAQEESSATGEWLTFSGNPARTGSTTMAGPPEEVELKWRWQVRNDKAPVSASPAVTAEGVVCITTGGGYAAAVMPGDGPGWIYTIDGASGVSPVVTQEGNIFAVTDEGYAYYLAPSGELQWKADFYAGIAASPVVSGSTAYMGTDDKTLIAVTLQPDVTGIDHDSGKILFSDAIKWSFLAAGTVKAAPAFAGNTIFFGGGNYFYALNPNAAGSSDNGSSLIKWSYDINADMHSSPAVYSGSVYVGADDGYLYALSENISNDAGTGEVLWKKPTMARDPVRSSPAVADAEGDIMIYVGADDGYLYAYDGQGEFEWRFLTGGPIRSSPAVDGNGDIYFGSDDGCIYALYADGSLKWKYRTGGSVRSSPAIGPGRRLYVGSDDGYLYCIGESTKETREPDITISVSRSLTDLETGGNPTTISATITSESEGESILSKIASVTIDLSALGLYGCHADGLVVSEDNGTAVCGTAGTIGREIMFDNGLYEDDVAGDGIFTYAFGFTQETEAAYEEGIFTHRFAGEFPGVGPVPVIITVTDLYGNQVSEPLPLNLVYKILGQAAPAAPLIETITSSLDKQTLNISFTSGTPTILSIAPNTGAPGERVSITLVGQNTNFTKNKTRIEIFNDQGFRIASALPGNDDVDVLSDTTLNAVLNIVNTEEVTRGSLTGRWDVTVTTEFASGNTEVVVGDDLFEISGASARTVPASRTDAAAYADEQCRFILDVTNELGARPENAPWEINTGYSRQVRIEEARAGDWDFEVSIQDCDSLPSFKIVTSGSNFGYLTGEVRSALTGEGIDNATITALTGAGSQRELNSTKSSGGGYYLLPLSAADEKYTIIASKQGMTDVEREIEIEADAEVQQNFSLSPRVQCPISAFGERAALPLFYRVRDEILERSAQGRRWAALYYAFSDEAAEIVRSSPAARKAFLQCCAAAAQAAPAVLSGTPLRKRTCASLRSHVMECISVLSAHGSPALQQALAAERDAVRTFLTTMDARPVTPSLQ